METDRSNINRYHVNSGGKTAERDVVATEEPLQIDLIHNNHQQTYSITMRTPGYDKYLACGLLFAEGVIASFNDIVRVKELKVAEIVDANLIEISLNSSIELDLESSSRRLNSYSGCGICGKTSLKALELKKPRIIKNLRSELTLEQISKVRKILASQSLFSGTGGSHVAGIIYEAIKDDEYYLDFTSSKCFEDVGRHNALDKLIGYEFVKHNLSKSGIIILSGRVGFELVQKVVMAGFSTIVALGAPSSLAIKTANQFGLTLIGFAKNDLYNIYTF